MLWTGRSIHGTSPLKVVLSQAQRRTFQSPAHRRMLQRQRRNAATTFQQEPLMPPQQQVSLKSPSLATAQDMPHDIREFDNQTLLALASMKNHPARIEVLKRHIMRIDNVSYEDACLVFEDIKKSNRRGMTIASLPYLIGITAAIGAGFGSMPLVFYDPWVHSFNEAFVTADIPEAKDLETALEVGSWSWNWMEPVLGSLSFTLLCLQFSRAQLENLGVRPFTKIVKRYRARRLCREFPGYDKRILSDFSKTDNILGKG